MVQNRFQKEFSLNQIQNPPNNETWVIIRDCVYNVTKFLPDHPGGGEIIMECAGKDITDDFKRIGHSKEAYNILNKLAIGIVKKT